MPLIKNLPPEIKVKALNNAVEFDGESPMSDILAKQIINAFDWSRSPEGADYWSYVDNTGVEPELRAITEVTLQEIAAWKGVSVDQIRIKAC